MIYNPLQIYHIIGGNKINILLLWIFGQNSRLKFLLFPNFVALECHCAIIFLKEAHYNGLLYYNIILSKNNYNIGGGGGTESNI